MKTNLLIDTNILINAFNKDSTFLNAATSILLNPSFIFFITSKNISEFFAVTSKLKISFETSFKFYNDLKNNATILFPSENSLLIFETLIQQYEPKGNQVFDIEIVSIMLANEIKLIATFNRKDFIDISEIEMLNIV